jgi:DNA-binding transcriptional MerR regulator
MDDGALYTLDELTGLVGAALSVDYPGAPTARVRDVPDRRAIRWYVTRGLVDRPVAARGRVALYSRRHLLQLVAIKRRQAEGHSLADIQAELTGATDTTLATVARLPTDHPPATTPRTAATPGRPRFWANSPAAQAGRLASVSTFSGPENVDTDASRREQVVALQGIRLAPGVTLLIEDGAAVTVDPTAIQAAAQPLLDLLAAGGHACEKE